jgi:hypothetical protein
MPGMRFSLRWLLFATAFVALVAGAIVSRSTFMADIVWLLTFTTFCYAVVTACFGKGTRRAMALGFALFAAGHFGSLFALESRIPTSRLFRLAGYRVSDEMLYSPEFVETRTIDGKSTPHSRRQRIESGTAVVRTANAVVTLAAGLIGCGIGALAYRHSHEP